jgi:hypothetical protein
VAPWQSITIDRNGIAMKFEPTDLGRGDGKYAGLVITGDTVLDDIIGWTAKNSGIAEDMPVATQMFLGKLVDLYNNAVFRSAWRDAASLYLNIADNVKLSDKQKAEIETEFVANVTRYFNEDTSRQVTKDSSYYTRQAIATQLLIKPYLVKANGKVANLTADEIAELRKLQTTKKEFETKAKELSLLEMAALEASIEDLVLPEVEVTEDETTEDESPIN